MTHPFTALDLRPELLDAVAQLGFTEMTPIQARALPPALQGRDVKGHAETGSGKTAAFGLALLQTVDADAARPQALVLCPTRELADQVTDALRRLAARLPNLRVQPLVGGRAYREQAASLARGCAVVVGTPGRVDEHLRRGSLTLDALRVLVLDEADRMLDMGFADAVMGIVGACPAARQTLLFSATFPDAIESLAAAIQRDPAAVSVVETAQPDALVQRALLCEPDARAQRVADILAHYAPTAALVFCETREDCAGLAAFLVARGAVALALHGQLEQRERDDVLVQLANGSASVLVATNVAARGLDIPALPLVIVAELSPDPEIHVHRVGRTGRAGEAGLAISVVAGAHEAHRLARVEAFLGATIPREGPLPEAGRLDALTPPNRTLLLLAGRADKLRKADVIGALIQEGRVPPDAIGRIDLTDRTCAVAVARRYAHQAMKFVQGGRIKKKRVRATLLG